MTRNELIIETISKATGKDLADSRSLLMKTEPGRALLNSPDKILSSDEVVKLRTKFTEELPGILAWLSQEIMIQQPPKGTA